jgi:hypothetical protein
MHLLASVVNLLLLHLDALLLRVALALKIF